MFIAIPPGQSIKLKNALSAVGGHLVFETKDDADDAIRMLNPEYSNAYRICPLSDIEDFDIAGKVKLSSQ